MKEHSVRRMSAVELDLPRTARAAPAPPPSSPEPRVDGRLVRFVLDTVARVHGASRSWPAVVADAGVLLVAAKAVHTTVYPGVVITLVILAGFNVGRVYVSRSTLETQGVLWYPARIATPF